MYKLLIKNKGVVYEPIIMGEILISYTRGFNAGKIIFNVVKDDVIDYQEGNNVVLMEDGNVIFVGYVFSKSRTGKQIIKTTCYDQLRYLKNKDTMQYENKTYSELLRMICDDGFLKVGDIEDTKYRVFMRTERDKEYFQMLSAISDLTLSHTGVEYVLYDNAGSICLNSWKNMPTTKNIISYDVTCDFDYETSIENSFNRIKVNQIDDRSKRVKTIIAEDKNNMFNWGRLQYYVETSDVENVDEKARMLLELLNRKNRKLKIKNTIGDFNVRAGSIVPVIFENIGDISINSMMLVHSVTHKIKAGYHFMDLEVLNKDISPINSGKGLFKAAKASNNSTNSIDINVSGKRKEIISFAISKEGSKYSQANRFGKGSFDCSSLVLRAMKASGLDSTGDNLTSSSIHSDKRFMEISKTAIAPGDILWHKGHVAIYTGGNGTIEAMNPKKGVRRGQVGNRFTRFYRVKGIDNG